MALDKLFFAPVAKLTRTPHARDVAGGAMRVGRLLTLTGTYSEPSRLCYYSRFCCSTS